MIELRYGDGERRIVHPYTLENPPTPGDIAWRSLDSGELEQGE